MANYGFPAEPGIHAKNGPKSNDRNPAETPKTIRKPITEAAPESTENRSEIGPKSGQNRNDVSGFKEYKKVKCASRISPCSLSTTHALCLGAWVQNFFVRNAGVFLMKRISHQNLSIFFHLILQIIGFRSTSILPQNLSSNLDLYCQYSLPRTSPSPPYRMYLASRAVRKKVMTLQTSKNDDFSPKMQ